MPSIPEEEGQNGDRSPIIPMETSTPIWGSAPEPIWGSTPEPQIGSGAEPLILTKCAGSGYCDFEPQATPLNPCFWLPPPINLGIKQQQQQQPQPPPPLNLSGGSMREPQPPPPLNLSGGSKQPPPPLDLSGGSMREPQPPPPLNLSGGSRQPQQRHLQYDDSPLSPATLAGICQQREEEKAARSEAIRTAHQQFVEH